MAMAMATATSTVPACLRLLLRVLPHRLLLLVASVLVTLPAASRELLACHLAVLTADLTSFAAQSLLHWSGTQMALSARRARVTGLNCAISELSA